MVIEFTRFIIAKLDNAIISHNAIYIKSCLAALASSHPAAAMYLIPLYIVIVVANTTNILSKNLVNLTMSGGLLWSTLLLNACISRSPHIVPQN